MTAISVPVRDRLVVSPLSPAARAVTIRSGAQERHRIRLGGARLDGLPLAIELAAARLRSLSLTALVGRLDQRFGLLTGGSRTAPARQQTLQATVEWSYSLLNHAEQLLLRHLPVFAESFDLDAAEAVCGLGGIQASDVTGLLGSLVDKSLVVADPAGPALRYRLL